MVVNKCLRGSPGVPKPEQSKSPLPAWRMLAWESGRGLWNDHGRTGKRHSEGKKAQLARRGAGGAGTGRERGEGAAGGGGGGGGGGGLRTTRDMTIWGT